MPKRRRAAPSAQRAGAASLWAIGMLLAVPAAAQPAAHDDDPIGRYLQERGLVGAAASPAALPAATATPMPPTTRASSWPSRAADMVMTAMNFIDLPYRRGGESADSGFDCSGFTRHIFQTSLGLLLPRRVDDQAHAPGLVHVAREHIEPGDLVFFNTLRRTFSHVGIYVGEGRFIHAPRSGGAVRMESMNIAYWSKRFTGARRSAQALARDTAAHPAQPPVQALAHPATPPYTEPTPLTGVPTTVPTPVAPPPADSAPN
jgi:cell wall-associated NlpC family hydrolase